MGAPAITLRLAELRDAHELSLMSRDYVEAGLGWKYDAARLLGTIRHRDTVTLVACERGAIAGFAIMEFGDERAHLVLLAVRPSHRRLGVGRRLVAWLLDSARTAGIESVHLELRAGNEGARRFYRAVGFAETLLVPAYYRGKEPALRMLRMLRAPGAAVAHSWRPPRTEDL
jgi:ribosomal protein S18 acetylase RimI-like enzyme